MDHFEGLCLKTTGKAVGNQGIKWGEKIFLDLDYADDFSILEENVSKTFSGFVSSRC